ncbi:hypothetical protein TIFTF001_022644 [Ficus carica]|uniref:Sieve element occlusion C-terminal domain-containing protein n=1 Tax=Ficus carica TaxID=3494 RepID=A0AA88DBW1_FICCA|nr:hypothetical protein TIFTF001_022644 [Ficus carica]
MSCVLLIKQIKDEKRYIFIYGGRDEAWTKKFQETLKSVEHLITRRSETKIIWFCVEKTVSSQFWSGVEKWYSDTEDNGKLEREIKQIQTLLSYKNQEGWVLLCKGPRAVMSGHGQTVLEVLEEFKSDWETESVKIDLKSSTFEKVFEEYHTKIINKNGAHCCQLQIEASNGEQVKEKKCTVCSATMKVKIAYECCHEGTPVAAHR